MMYWLFFFFSSRRRHTRYIGDWSSDVCSSDLGNSNMALAAGAAFTWGAPALTIPSTVAPGNYYIGILVDRANATPETNEGNNFKSTPLTVAVPQPDLIVATLTHAPANPTTADLIRCTAVVRNAGSATAGASTLEFRIGGETPGAPQTRFAVPALAAGQTATVQRELQLTAGNYRNTATADVANVVAESDETNNVTTDDYTVTLALAADLVISAPATLTVTPTTVAPGGTVQLPAWTVRNQGTAASNAFSNGFYLS